MVRLASQWLAGLVTTIMRRYSPPYRSPPRRGYGGRGRSPPRRGYGGRREQGSGSLLVRNIPLSCREPRGFAFVEFVDPYDASEAQYHMNRQVFFGREITVVLAAESRKRPEEMRNRDKVRGYSGNEGRRSSYHELLIAPIVSYREVSFSFSLPPLSGSSTVKVIFSCSKTPLGFPREKGHTTHKIS
ncbi:hypothetical protein ABZP36_011209 [Zizania latifolia]